MEYDFGFTVRENDLLNRMAARELDGPVGIPVITDHGGAFRLVIQAGTPILYFEQPPEFEIVDGKEVRSLGILRRLKEWRTDIEKLEFLSEYGKIINDEVVQNYAMKLN